MTFGAVFPRVLRPVFGPGLAAVAAAANWWEAGGASGAVAAYQPKGAASLAASYINLANPGTYDAAPYPTSGFAPAWNATDGWTFAGAQRLTTSISGVTVGSGGWSMIIRVSDAASSSGCAMGVYNASNNSFAIFPYLASRVYYTINADNFASPQLITGTLAIAGNSGYRNGAFDKALSGSGSPTGNIVMGSRNEAVSIYWTGKLQAAAIYNTTLTAPQVAAISSAMAAL